MADFKSKTLQAIQDKKVAEKQSAADKIIQAFTRVKQRVDELVGERKGNRAIRQSDFDPARTVRLKSEPVGDIPSPTEFNRLRTDVENIYRLLAKIAGEDR